MWVDNQGFGDPFELNPSGTTISYEHGDPYMPSDETQLRLLAKELWPINPNSE